MTPTPARRDPRSLLVLPALLALCLGVGALGGWIARPAIEGWYRSLAKPDWTPPDAAFAPVWTTLYSLMAIAAWLALARPRGRPRLRPVRRRARAQPRLVVPVLRPALAARRARRHRPAVAADRGDHGAFWRASRLAGVLMVPLLLWVSYALALNAAIFALNS